MDTYTIHTELRHIIYNTEKLDFPIFSSLEKKQQIVKTEREKIDAQIDHIINKTDIDFTAITQLRQNLWEEADSAARAEFGALSEKEMLNGFYLQEVMHRYAELQARAILDILGCS